MTIIYIALGIIVFLFMVIATSLRDLQERTNRLTAANFDLVEALKLQQEMNDKFMVTIKVLIQNIHCLNSTSDDKN